jgi:short subunit dehydrogenase-like uncharacterized protein
MAGMPRPSKPYDVVVFGATSFVGQILVRELFETFGLDGDLRWAAAGRSRTKLEQVRKTLGRGAGRLALLTADAADAAALRKLCASARAIVSTVGPYALHGEPLVQACAESGTDYCDLAGEVQWIRRMIARHAATARATGARLVPCCGFDSIPSDLGVHVLQQEARRRFGEPCREVRMRVRAIRGGASGGTVAAMLNLVREVAKDPALRKELADPYSLWTEGEKPRVRQHEVRWPEYDADFGAWAAPFVMGAVNTRVVHRSNMLAHAAYGRDFRYDEAVLTGRGVRGRLGATALAGGLAAFMVGGSLGPVRAALERFVLPAPGEGPSPEAQARGFYDLRFVGRTRDGRSLRGKVTGDRDPGYGSTARMLSQAAACLALEAGDAPGGFWTPATLLGGRLVARLRAHAGLTFDTYD